MGMSGQGFAPRLRPRRSSLMASPGEKSLHFPGLWVAALAGVATLAGYERAPRLAGWPTMETVADVERTIAANIVLARKLAGVSQRDLARKLGLADEKEISRYENGRRTPAADDWS